MHTLFKTTLLTLSLFLLIGCGGESRSKTPPPNTPNNLPDSPTPNGTPETDNPFTQDTGSTGGIDETHNTSASINVLVLYDNEVATEVNNVSAIVRHHFAVANSAYADSGLNVSVNIAAIVKYNVQIHGEKVLEDISSSTKVDELRTKYHADTVLLYQILLDAKVGDTVQCGIAYSAKSYEKENLFKGGMFAQVEINCPANTTVHELGHNMGLTHSHLQNDKDKDKPTYSYGLGHGVDERFVTIMAYGYLFNTENEILKFSSPEYECLPGYPCGIAVGQPGEAHASKVIQYTAPKIANLY